MKAIIFPRKPSQPITHSNKEKWGSDSSSCSDHFHTEPQPRSSRRITSATPPNSRRFELRPTSGLVPWGRRPPATCCRASSKRPLGVTR